MTAPHITAKRRSEEKRQRRQSILDAAAAVVRRKGLDALTMGDVAQEARLSRGLLYVYFKDKLDLANGLAHSAILNLTDRFRTAASAHTAGFDQVNAMGHAYVQFAQERPVLFESLARFETREADPDEADHEQAATLSVTHEAMQVMMRAITDGQADGSIRASLDPAKTAVTLWGFMHGMIQVSAMKHAMLEQAFGFGPSALMDHAFNMANLALTPLPSS
ncbi:MAG: TetR/AcrR family transcriptional regulator [Bacteroidota bacterium]